MAKVNGSYSRFETTMVENILNWFVSRLAAESGRHVCGDGCEMVADPYILPRFLTAFHL